jgi:hypothetical protein
MYSTIGLQPFIAEPTAIPVNPSSAMGINYSFFSKLDAFLLVLYSTIMFRNLFTH